LLASLASFGVTADPAPSAPGPATRLRGTIVERALARGADGEPRQTAKLRTEDGRVVLLDLGAPGGEGTIRPGDAVIVTGRPEMRDGRPAFAVGAIIQQFAR
jgi:hypothetical protein